ncbi:replication-relaxation family protein [Streptomyces sp. NPDC051555]|uniref:replication-relaxation family protein n=1 Tax=Streptomyces sp. NPDC051555 TaxID=3365657 RepID=UPI0037B5A7A0
MKIATAAQLRDLTCPGTASAATVRGGCKDLEAAGMVISAGRTSRVEEDGRRITEKLWSLTTLGLEAAAVPLERPVREMGGTARSAAASGARHAVKVTDTIAAFVQAPVEETEAPVAATRARPRTAPAVQLRERPAGLGPLAAWTTEVTLPVGGTFGAPVKGSLRADAVFALPDTAVPLLFLEVDNGTEPPSVLADKIRRYRKFFVRTATTGGPVLWRTVWEAPVSRVHPPVAIVFTKRMGTEAMQTRMRRVAELCQDEWLGMRKVDYDPKVSRDGYFDYQGRVPVVVTHLDRLAELGPHGPIWWRYGRKAREETLAVALDSTVSERGFRAREAQRKREAEVLEAAEQLEAEQRREASAWPCPSCGKPVYPDDWGTRPDPGSTCYDCQRADAERARQQRADGEAAAEQAEYERQRRADGWLGWLPGRH